VPSLPGEGLGWTIYRPSMRGFCLSPPSPRCAAAVAAPLPSGTPWLLTLSGVGAPGGPHPTRCSVEPSGQRETPPACGPGGVSGELSGLSPSRSVRSILRRPPVGWRAKTKAHYAYRWFAPAAGCANPQPASSSFRRRRNRERSFWPSGSRFVPRCEGWMVCPAEWGPVGTKGSYVRPGKASSAILQFFSKSSGGRRRPL